MQNIPTLLIMIGAIESNHLLERGILLPVKFNLEVHLQLLEYNVCTLILFLFVLSCTLVTITTMFLTSMCIQTDKGNKFNNILSDVIKQSLSFKKVKKLQNIKKILDLKIKQTQTHHLNIRIRGQKSSF